MAPAPVLVPALAASGVAWSPPDFADHVAAPNGTAPLLVGGRSMTSTQDVAAGGHKLDSAMSVLTSLLVDLEEELWEQGAVGGAAGGAGARLGPKPKPVVAAEVPSPEVSARADKLDNALSNLTRHLAELERHLRGGQSPRGSAVALGTPASAAPAPALEGASGRSPAAPGAVADVPQKQREAGSPAAPELDAAQAKVCSLWAGGAQPQPQGQGQGKFARWMQEMAPAPTSGGETSPQLGQPSAQKQPPWGQPAVQPAPQQVAWQPQQLRPWQLQQQQQPEQRAPWSAVPVSPVTPVSLDTAPALPAPVPIQAAPVAHIVRMPGAISPPAPQALPPGRGSVGSQGSSAQAAQQQTRPPSRSSSAAQVGTATPATPATPAAAHPGARQPPPPVQPRSGALDTPGPAAVRQVVDIPGPAALRQAPDTPGPAALRQAAPAPAQRAPSAAPYNGAPRGAAGTSPPPGPRAAGGGASAGAVRRVQGRVVPPAARDRSSSPLPYAVQLGERYPVHGGSQGPRRAQATACQTPRPPSQMSRSPGPAGGSGLPPSAQPGPTRLYSAPQGGGCRAQQQGQGAGQAAADRSHSPGPSAHRAPGGPQGAPGPPGPLAAADGPPTAGGLAAAEPPPAGRPGGHPGGPAALPLHALRGQVAGPPGMASSGPLLCGPPSVGGAPSVATAPLPAGGAHGQPHVPQSMPNMPQPLPMAMCPRSNSVTSSSASFYFPGGQLQGPLTHGPAVPAISYAPEPSDPIDMMVASGLATLERGTAMKLLLRRLAPGKYDIDGRKVTVRWGCEPGKGAELLAREDEVSDSSAAEMPLVAYLSQAANVAASLSGQRSDMPKIARIPKAQRLTFADAAADSTKDATAQIDKVGNQRCESMRIACEQARLREEAAVAYEQHGGQHGMFAPGPLQRSLRPPSGLPLPYLN